MNPIVELGVEKRGGEMGSWTIPPLASKRVKSNTSSILGTVRDLIDLMEY